MLGQQSSGSAQTTVSMNYQRRFEPVLRRVRSGRRFTPVGTGSFLFSRLYVGDAATAELSLSSVTATLVSASTSLRPNGTNAIVL